MSGTEEVMLAGPDMIRIDMLRTPVWHTFFALITATVALFIVLFYIPLEVAVPVALILVACILVIAFVGWWPMRFQLDGTGVSYRRTLFKKTIIWNDLASVVFEMHPPPKLEDFGRTEGLSTYRGGSHAMPFGPRGYDTITPLPSFNCSMTFIGDKVIKMKTERYDGPSPTEFREAWEYIARKQRFFNFEAEMKRRYQRGWSGLPQLLKPV